MNARRSHRQRTDAALLQDIQRYCLASTARVIITLNIDEPLAFSESDFRFMLRVIRNPSLKVSAPIIIPRFRSPQPGITLRDESGYSLASRSFSSPIVVPSKRFGGSSCSAGSEWRATIEDSARRLPTPLRIIRRALFGSNSLDYEIDKHEFTPDWVGEMCMFFPRAVFQAINGFDERYFLYYEDVDLCCRLRLAGYRIVVNSAAVVIHNAQRQSHRSLSYLRRHIASMLRFFSSRVFFACLRQKRLALRQ